MIQRENVWDVSGIIGRVKNKSWRHNSNVTLGTTLIVWENRVGS